MLTKNFYNSVMTQLTKKNITNGYVLSDGTIGIAAPSTATKQMWDYMCNLLPNNDLSNVAQAGVRIGKGVTPATADDYTLESFITSGVSINNPSAVSVTMEEGYVAAYCTYTVTNTGTTAIAISEIGLFSQITASSVAKLVLMDRTVLESPITINPGQSKPITYTIRFNYPTE